MDSVYRDDFHEEATWDKFHEDQQRLNLVKDSEDIYRCHGRIQGKKPIYLPSSAKFTEELMKDAHIQSIHEG